MASRLYRAHLCKRGSFSVSRTSSRFHSFRYNAQKPISQKSHCFTAKTCKYEAYFAGKGALECEEIQPEKSSKKELRDRGSRTKDYVFLYFGFGRVPEESFSTYRRQFYLGFGRVVLGVRMQTGIFINEGGFFLVEELFIFDKLGLAKRRKSVSPRWNFGYTPSYVKLNLDG